MSDESNQEFITGAEADKIFADAFEKKAKRERVELIAAKEEAVARGKEAWDYDKFESFYDYYRTSKESLEWYYYVSFIGKSYMTIEEFAEKLKNLEDWDR